MFEGRNEGLGGTVFFYKDSLGKACLLREALGLLVTLEVHRTDNVDEDESFLRHGILFKVTLDDLDSKCLFAAKNQIAGNPLTALFFFFEENKTSCRTPVHSKCHRSILFFRKLYFFFYKSTTGTKVKE